MRSLHFYQLFGSGLLLAGLASLSLASPATAQTTGINKSAALNDYQIGRHYLSAPTSTDTVEQTQSTSTVEQTQSTSNYGTGGVDTNSTDINKSAALSDYQIGRHALWQ